jgi:hypothetical protein
MLINRIGVPAQEEDALMNPFEGGLSSHFFSTSSSILGRESIGLNGGVNTLSGGIR